MSLEKKDTLGILCKADEKAFATIHSSSQAIYVRIDGRSFSKVTKQCDRPFDDLLAQIMRNVALGFMHEFRPDAAFVQSDEISLMFLPKETEGFSHLFGGKQQKLTSVLASFANWSFLTNVVANRFGKIDISKPITFDCRTVSCDPDQALLHFLWRHQDCSRNAYQSVCQYIAKEVNRDPSWRDKAHSSWLDREGVAEWRKEIFANLSAMDHKWGHWAVNGGHKISLDRVSVDMQKKLVGYSGFPWNNLPGYLKYGTCYVRKEGGVIAELSIPKIYHQLRKELDFDTDV